MTEHLKAERHERNDDRQGYRKVSRIWDLSPRVGPILLPLCQPPKDRNLSSPPFFFQALLVIDTQERSEGPLRYRAQSSPPGHG